MSFIKTHYSPSVCESDLESVFSGYELFFFFSVYSSPFLYYGLYPSLSLQQISRVIRKSVFAYTKTNKGTDQLRRNRAADQCLCFRYIDFNCLLRLFLFSLLWLLSFSFTASLFLQIRKQRCSSAVQ